MTMTFLECKADRPRWPEVALLVLVTILLGACGGVAELDEELARLVALSAVNPNVRDSEVAALREQREQTLAIDVPEG